MLKIFLLTAALLTLGVGLAPVASAECVPLLDPDFCDGPADPAVDRVKDTVERLGDMECYTYRDHPEKGIRCEF